MKPVSQLRRPLTDAQREKRWRELKVRFWTDCLFWLMRALDDGRINAALSMEIRETYGVLIGRAENFEAAWYELIGRAPKSGE